MIFDRIMLAYMDEQGEMGLLEPISILFFFDTFFVKTGNNACIWRTSVIFYYGMKRAVLCRRCPEKGGAPRK